MKAMVQDTYGPPEVLQLRDVDTPAIGAEDVLVRVAAAGVDPGVWHLMTGLPYIGRLAFGARRPKVAVRGMDVAGHVEAVGANVTRFRPGDAVFGTCQGAYAEYARAAQSSLAPMPANLTPEQAAAVPVSGCTALQSLRDKGHLEPGQRVLVIGAAGGIGTYAVQLAAAMGAHVTGVCSTGKLELVRSLGADEVIDYTREDFADGARRYDLVLDIAGNRALTHLRRALAPRGTLVIVGGEGGGRWFQGVDRQLRALALTPFINQRLCTLIATQPAADLEHLRELIESGAVRPVVDRTYPLREVPDAIRRLHETHARGKLVITVPG